MQSQCFRKRPFYQASMKRVKSGLHGPLMRLFGLSYESMTLLGAFWRDSENPTVISRSVVTRTPLPSRLKLGTTPACATRQAALGYWLLKKAGCCPANNVSTARPLRQKPCTWLLRPGAHKSRPGSRVPSGRTAVPSRFFAGSRTRRMTTKYTNLIAQQ